MASSGRRHRGLFALALVAACGQALPGFAKEAWNGCFKRVYDAAHLAAHPGQTVISIAVEIRTSTYQKIAYAYPTLTLRGKKMKYYSGGVGCTANAAGLHCTTDTDAGSFTLARWGAGVKLVVTGDLALARAFLEEGGIEGNAVYVGANNSEDRTFLLPPAPAAACKWW